MPSSFPELLPVPDEAPSGELIARVRDALASGGVVAMPTETVYGLGVRADRVEALERLAGLKGSPAGRPWTWHVGSNEAIERFEALAPLAERLVERYWPGPLTLILKGVPHGLEHVATDGWTGLRLPAQKAVAGLLAELDFPVVLSSANDHGKTPFTEAREVAEHFGEALALVLDGGPSRLGEPSGILRVGPGSFELMREGLLPIEDLRRTAGLSLLFVCTGNTCRSPMAEALAKAELRRRLQTDRITDFGFEVQSAGVFAPPGSPASNFSVDAMSTRGIHIAGHSSSTAAGALLENADRVYGLTRSHLQALAQRMGRTAGEKLFLLDPEGRDVPDPIGGTREDYEHCAQIIETAIAVRAEDWA